MDLLKIKGVGEKSLKKFNNLGINTVDDLINYYPFRYDVLKKTALIEGEKVIIDGVVTTTPYVRFFGKRDMMNFKLDTGLKILNVSIFNRGFLKRYINIGGKITLIGKLTNNKFVASDIKLMELGNKVIIEPVYRVVKGLNKSALQKSIRSALSETNEFKDYIPFYLNEKYSLMDKKEALFNIHFPNNLEKLKKAKIKLKYEELFRYMLKVNYLKLNNNEKSNGIKREVSFENVKSLINKFPFSLTHDQEKVMGEIFVDLNSDKRMNRMIQGDVGSGKTVLSVIALYINYLGNYQGALMVPTEILAVQHYNKFIDYFKDYNLNIKLLTGKTKNKKELYEDLKNGKVDIVIGTHALIQDAVEFKNLGLVITDEQHRFGVKQRENLKNKGEVTDILYMSATPIPRTYALVLYGDMDVSKIQEKPSGRKKIETSILSSKEIKKLLGMMLKELRQNNQIYVVAPLVNESEVTDLTDVYNLEKEMEKVFKGEFNIDIMHGKLKNTEKNEIMKRFENKETNILISTTVIEVGVDVKDATMIIIFDADRFGLATLHQLRGRVGRGDKQSYCVLISDTEKERLNVMVETEDGFKIAEEDFKLRGYGDLFGTKQSGDMVFKIADLKEDYKILLQAQKDSMEFLKNENFENFKVLKEEIEKYF